MKAPTADVSPVSLSRVKNDKHYSAAFSQLESAIEDMNGALSVLELAANSSVFKAEGCTAKDIKKKYGGGLDPYTIHIFNDAQIDGLVYALYHALNVGRQLRDEYRAAYENEKEPA